MLSTGFALDRIQQKCMSFMPERYVANSTRAILAYETGGRILMFPDNDESCHREKQALGANICRVALSIPTSNRSSVTFELWLPDQWSGRFLATGNGNVDGCVFNLLFVVGMSLLISRTQVRSTKNSRMVFRMALPLLGLTMGTTGLRSSPPCITKKSWRIMHINREQKQKQQ